MIGQLRRQNSTPQTLCGNTKLHLRTLESGLRRQQGGTPKIVGLARARSDAAKFDLQSLDSVY